MDMETIVHAILVAIEHAIIYFSIIGNWPFDAFGPFAFF